MLRIIGLQKSYGARTLFADISYHFPASERIALVGANGAGKTTLLDILSGLEAPDAGQVVTPGNVRVGYLPQKPNPDPEGSVLEEAKAGARHLVALEREMQRALGALEASGGHEGAALARYEKAETAFRLAGGYSLEAKATSILRGLGFARDDLDKRPEALSGGWRMRLELARLFLSEPDFLILDEPTNHLDLPSLVWVESWLMAFRGTLLFVSHDRALLNRLATITLHLAHGKLTPYRGNFDKFLEQREARLEQELAQAEQLRRRRESMERFVQRFGAKATKATQAQSRLKMIARIREVEDNLDLEGPEAEVMIEIPPAPKTPRLIYEIQRGAIGYQRPLATGLTLGIERGHKIAVIGANGIGKSTMLRTIAGRLPPLSGSFAATPGVAVAYFAQDQGETLDLEATVLENLLRAGDLGEKAARQLLGGFLFRGDDVFKRTRVLSGGELSRLGLACTLSKQAGLLLLDEPTNHLDMASVETLAAGIDSYEGTVLFVSHDRTFIDAVCTHVFAMLPDGRSMLFPGKLADYERLAEVAGFPNVLQADAENRAASQPPATLTPGASGAKESAPPSHQEARELKAQRQKLQRRIDQLDQTMATLRSQLTKIEGTMADLDPSDYTGAQTLVAEAQQARDRLEAQEQEWLEASEVLETVTSRLAAMGRD